MKKRKHQAHLNIKIAKRQKQVLRWHQKLPKFAYSNKYIRDLFAPRPKQWRRMYLYLERIGKV